MLKSDLMRHLLWIERNCDAEATVRALQRNAFLICAPFAIAIAATAVWYLAIWRTGWFCTAESATQHGTIIQILFMVFAIPAGLTFYSSWQRYESMRRAVWLGDKREFMIIRDNAVPVKMHIMLGSMGLVGLLLIMAAGYPSLMSGTLSVFSSWFVMIMYFIATMQLQHPSTSAWFNAEAPKEWIEGDTRAYLTSIGVMKCPAE